LVIDKAGGQFGKQGDYLYTAFLPDQALLGAWGLFRVGNPGTPAPNGICASSAPTQAAPPEKVNPLIQRFRRKPLNPGGNQNR
jgi:hypothetical protein